MLQLRSWQRRGNTVGTTVGPTPIATVFLIIRFHRFLELEDTGVGSYLGRFINTKNTSIFHTVVMHAESRPKVPIISKEVI